MLTQSLRELNKIYDKIPSLECREGCHKCCSPHDWFLIEGINIRRWLRKRKQPLLKANQNGIDCPYVINGRCSIYPVRPLICRAFGVVDTADEEFTNMMNRVNEISREMSKTLGLPEPKGLPPAMKYVLDIIKKGEIHLR